MANSIQSNLSYTIVSDSTVNLLQSKLAPLQVFSRQFSTNPMAPRSSVVVPLATATSATQVNPTDYEQGDTTISGSVVQVNQIVQMWHRSDADIQSGLNFGSFDEINVRQFANKLNDLVLANVTSANFNTASCNLTVSSSNFSTTQLKSMRADIANYEIKNVVLDGMSYSQFIGVNLQSYNLKEGGPVFGFDAFTENNRLNQCGTACSAFVCSPDAICMVSGLPIVPSTSSDVITHSEVLMIPGINLGVLFETFFSAKTRSEHRALRVMFGSNVGNKNALRYFVSP